MLPCGRAQLLPVHSERPRQGIRHPAHRLLALCQPPLAKRIGSGLRQPQRGISRAGEGIGDDVSSLLEGRGLEGDAEGINQSGLLVLSPLPCRDRFEDVGLLPDAKPFGNADHPGLNPWFRQIRGERLNPVRLLDHLVQEVDNGRWFGEHLHHGSVDPLACLQRWPGERPQHRRILRQRHQVVPSRLTRVPISRSIGQRLEADHKAPVDARRFLLHALRQLLCQVVLFCDRQLTHRLREADLLKERR